MCDYSYTDSNLTYSSSYLLPVLIKLVEQSISSDDKRIFEIGCGNGATAHVLSDMGFEVTGIDTSVSGIKIARQSGKGVFEVADVCDDLAAVYGLMIP